MRIFLAGAAGAIGRRLVPLLHAAKLTVIGTTRSAEKAEELRELGVIPVIIDMFDAEAVHRAVLAARPDVVVHQLTDLPKHFDPVAMTDARIRNARLREVTTPILMHAAQAAGVRRAIVQSICFAYAPGRTPHAEGDPLDSPGLAAMETTVLHTPGVDGVVLRYGRLWGPGTWADRPPPTSPLHVDAAAQAALLAMTRGHGVYNIAADDGTVATSKARIELGFDPDFRLPG
jgi:nucleoside-diphosphate-sugar epimerase